jgi:alpha-beta hydrolase superfamily lysophospholipase
MPSDLPVFFIAGADDPVGSCGKGVQKTMQLFRNAGMQHITGKIYPGARHELLNEQEREMVFQDIDQWLENLAGI